LEILRTPISPELQPLKRLSLRFAPVEVRTIRIALPGPIHEVRILYLSVRGSEFGWVMPACWFLRLWTDPAGLG